MDAERDRAPVLERKEVVVWAGGGKRLRSEQKLIGSFVCILGTGMTMHTSNTVCII